MAEQDEVGRLVERVARLEEGQGYAERGAEGVSAEVYALGRRLEELVKRVSRLERAVEKGMEGPGEDGQHVPG